MIVVRYHSVCEMAQACGVSRYKAYYLLRKLQLKPAVGIGHVRGYDDTTVETLHKCVQLQQSCDNLVDSPGGAG